MNYNVKRLIIMLSWGFWAAFFAVFAFENKAYLIVSLIMFFIHGLALSSKLFRCPKCNKDVFYNPISFFGTRIWIMTLNYPNHCSKCGYPLRQNNK